MARTGHQGQIGTALDRHWRHLPIDFHRNEDVFKSVGMKLDRPHPERRMDPRLGELVLLSGIRSRPALNGASAEVVSEDVDDDGFVTVRVADSVGARGNPKGYRTMKMHPRRLRPLTTYGLATFGSSVPSPLIHELSGGTGSSVGDRESVLSFPSRAPSSVAPSRRLAHSASEPGGFGTR
mmetsp:Transcript_334/g.1092  ORF Transcript_334/g.1092 Transcript_334/m.1092 type:complete len:180 (+) Transcript_334:80-619(+)